MHFISNTAHFAAQIPPQLKHSANSNTSIRLLLKQHLLKNLFKMAIYSRTYLQFLNMDNIVSYFS